MISFVDGSLIFKENNGAYCFISTWYSQNSKYYYIYKSGE